MRSAPGWSGRGRGCAAAAAISALLGLATVAEAQLELPPAPNRIPGELLASSITQQVFPSAVGTVVDDGTALMFFDPGGELRNRVDFARGPSHRMVASAPIQGGDRRFFVVQPAGPGAATARVFDQLGDELASFEIEARRGIFPSPGGEFLVSAGAAYTHQPPLGEAVEREPVAIVVYSIEGNTLGRLNGIENSLVLHQVDPSGRLAVRKIGPAGEPQVAVVLPSGETLWEENLEPPDIATELVFASRGEILFENRYFNDLDRPQRTVLVRSTAGEVIYRHQSELPTAIRAAGETLVAVHEAVGRARHRFVFVDAARAAEVGRFEVDLVVQRFAVRQLAEGPVAVALVYENDDRAARLRVQLRLESGELLDESDLSADGGPLVSRLLSPWGDGSLLVVGDGALRLLTASQP